MSRKTKLALLILAIFTMLALYGIVVYQLASSQKGRIERADLEKKLSEQYRYTITITLFPDTRYPNAHTDFANKFRLEPNYLGQGVEHLILEDGASVESLSLEGPYKIKRYSEVKIPLAPPINVDIQAHLK